MVQVRGRGGRRVDGKGMIGRKRRKLGVRDDQVDSKADEVQL